LGLQLYFNNDLEVMIGEILEIPENSEIETVCKSQEG
jgi:hypothetical protein